MKKTHKYVCPKSTNILTENNFQKIKTTLIPFNYAVTTHTIESRTKFIDFHNSNLGGDP